jgi:hypothetical protein
MGVRLIGVIRPAPPHLGLKFDGFLKMERPFVARAVEVWGCPLVDAYCGWRIILILAARQGSQFLHRFRNPIARNESWLDVHYL